LNYKIADIEIPFSIKTKELISYVGWNTTDIIWKQNYTFEKILTASDMSRGQSSATFTLVDDEGLEHNMFMKDMLTMVQNAKIEYGKINAVWTFIKRGQNYGIRFLENVN